MRRCFAALGIMLLLATSSVAFAQTQEAIAQTRFGKGREFFIAGKFGEALTEFKAAGELFESPNTRLYIARCERELGHIAAAYVEYERAASEAADRAHADPRYVATRDAAKQEGSALQSKLGRVTILAPAALPDGAVITINGAPLAPAGVGVPAPIDPGNVEVVARAPGRQTMRRTVQVAAGEAVEIKVQLDAAPAASGTTEAGTGPTATTTGAGPETARATATESGTAPPDTAPHSGRGLRNAGFVVGGIGIVGMGVFAAFAALAQTRFDQLKTQCNGPCDPSFNPKIDEGQMYQNVANIALAAGGAALVVGTIMIVAGASASGPSPSSGASARHGSPLQATVVPVWSAQGPSGVMVGVGRAF